MKTTFNKILNISLVLITLIAFSGKAWGAIANPYSFTFANKDLTTSSTSFTKGEVQWSLSDTENQWNGTANKTGYVFGSANSPKNLSVSTSGISGTITQVSVTGRSNNNGQTATVAVTVGTTGFTTTDDSWDNGNNQTLVFTGSASGTIEVSITPDACGFVLSGISVTYSAGPTTYTVTVNSSNTNYGTVSQASVTNVANNTSISASSNVLTVGTTTVTATEHAQDADYSYSFSNWTGIPAGGKVTGNITVTANFTRTERALTNYRTLCCTSLGSINGSVSSTTPTSATVGWTIPVDDYSQKKAAGVILRLYNDNNGSKGTLKETVNTYASDNSIISHTFSTGLSAGTKYWFTIELKGTTASGVTYCDSGEGTAVSFTTPKITVTGTPSAMSYNQGSGPSAPQSFTVAAVGMVGDVTVTAPTNFEVSTSNNSGFGSSVVLSPTSGTVSSTAIYVRLVSGLNVGSYPAAGTSNVTVSGNFATTVNVAVSGTVANPCSAAPTVSAATSSAKTMTSIIVNCAGLTALGTGGCTIDHYGFVYGTSTAPKHPSDNSGTGIVKEVGTTYTTTGTAFGATTITGLTKATKYYIRPYAHNDCGWAYGDEIEVTTLDLKSLSVTAPTKVAYFQGETFASAGAVVTATYTDNSEATVTTSATWDLTTLSTAGEITATASYTENGTTKTATTTINVYTVTVNMVKEDGETPLTSGPSVSWTLNTKTIAANEGSSLYAFKQWNVTGATAANTGNASTTLSNPTGNVTATAVFYNPIDVAWKVGTGNAGSGTTEVKYGTQMKDLTLPSDPDDDALSLCIPEDGRFMGWSEEQLKGDGHDAPDDLFTSLTATTAITSNKTFYAVFAKVVGGGDEWVETAIGSIASSDVVVIATPGGYAVSNDNGTSSAPTAVGITVSEGKITSTVANNIKWNIGGNATNGYIFYPNGTTSTWLYCNTTQNSGSNNNIRVGTGDRKYWIADSDGDYVTNDANTDRWLCNFNNADFRGYIGSAVTTDIVGIFYKKTSSVYISDYQTGCCTDPTTALSITGATSVALDNTLSLGTTGGNGGDVTWSVTNGTGSATISDAGVLSPLSVGTVTVKAHQDETNGKCEQNPTVEITIVGTTVHVSSVDVTPEAVALLPGETIQLTATVAPNDATDKSIKSWGSGTTTTATVSASGLVTAVAKGTSTVTATTNDGDFTDNCAVTVHGLTILKQDEDGTPISAEGVTATATGKSLSASATAASKYVFKGWSYKTASGMTGFTDASNASTTMTGTPNNDVIVIAEFYKPRVIKWSVNNDDTFDETTVAYGGSISSVPAVTSGLACASTFIAWTDDAHNNGETAKDDDSYYGEALYKAASDFPTNITDATTTYYAVFANSSGKAGYFYIGDDGVLEVGKTYIFVNSLSGDALGKAKALEATTLPSVNNSSKGKAADVTITSEPGVKYISTFNDDLEFECNSYDSETYAANLEVVASNYYMYLYIHGGGMGYKPNDNQAFYTAHKLYGQTSGGSPRYIQYNSGDDRFEITADETNMYAFKKQTASYSGYVTQCDMTKAKLTYVTPGGVPGCAETEVIFTKGEPVTICSTQPTPPTGYEFKEWNTATDGSGDAYTEGATIPAAKTEESVTLTAQWTPVAYTITYHLDGGTNGANPDTYTIETADIELVAATRGHDRFDGWFTDNGVWENKVTTIALGSHVDIDLYAKWTSRYEIQFKAADALVGTIWRAADEELNALVEGQGSEPSVTAPSLCGKMFAGWTKNKIEDVVVDAPADFMEEAMGTVNSNTIFYAVWADATPTTFTKVCDWEAASIPVEWKVSASIERTINQGYDGTYGGKINTNHTYVQFNHKVNATEFSFALRRTSNNTNGTVYIETSTDNSNWTAAETYEMSAFEESYTVKTKTFDGLSKLYVRFHCYNTTAVRYVDNVTIKYNNYAFTNYTTACHVTAEDAQTVDVTEENTISSLTVKQGGTVNLEASLTVNDFTIEAMEGFSGQVLNPNNLHINGNAYYDLTLNPSGTMDNSKWYAFAVPFQVDAATGIQRLSNDGVATYAGFNSHYRIKKYDTAKRLSTGKGWVDVTSGETLYPGHFYMISLNSNVYNRLRMTKKAGTNLSNIGDITLVTNGTGTDANWNALANNALAYVNLSASGDNADIKVQTYRNSTDPDGYDLFDFGEITLTVGTPFFVQAVASAVGGLNVAVAATNNETVKAPAREAVATEEFQLRIGADTESYYDKLYVSASEEALNEYQIGHDLQKAGVSTTVPQMYVPAYGTKLCDAEFPLVNNEATFPLTFTAPNAETYQLYVAKAAVDADLYLTYEGSIIWNLSMGEYEIDLEKGTTNGFGLLLQAKAPQVVTGVDEVDAETGIQKVIIDEHVFILRGGQMYDVTGKMVK